MKFSNQILFIFVIIILVQTRMCKRIKKRQIYREQVNPHTGGKIPESAFETDRLILNRLQKEGIAIPDGIILEQRNPKVFPYPHNSLRPVFKVLATSDNRFTDVAGDIFHSMPPVSETTYPIPRITEDSISVPIHTTVYQPVYRPFMLPNPLLQNPAFRSNIVPVVPQKDEHALLTTNFRTRNQKYPHSRSTTTTYFYQDFVTSQMFNDFATFIDHVYDIPFGATIR